MKKQRPKRKPRPWWWSWDLNWRPGTIPPSDKLSLREIRAIIAHPMSCGIGRHVRSLSDDTYIDGVAKVRENLDGQFFWEGWLALLIYTADIWVAGAGDNVLPTPAPPHPSQQWEAADVQRMMANPCYAGVPPFPAIVTPIVWAGVAVRCEREDKFEGFMRCVLTVMRETWGTPVDPVRDN